MAKPRMRADDNQRAALFGRRYNEIGQSASANTLEEQNDEHIADLEGQVSALREVSLNISQAVKESNRLLGDMGQGMDGAGKLVKGVVTRMSAFMASSSSGGTTCKLILFALFVILLLWISLQTTSFIR